MTAPPLFECIGTVYMKPSARFDMWSMLRKLPLERQDTDFKRAYGSYDTQREIGGATLYLNTLLRDSGDLPSTPEESGILYALGGYDRAKVSLAHFWQYAYGLEGHDATCYVAYVVRPNGEDGVVVKALPGVYPETFHASPYYTKGTIFITACPPRELG